MIFELINLIIFFFFIFFRYSSKFSNNKTGVSRCNQSRNGHNETLLVTRLTPPFLSNGISKTSRNINESETLLSS